MGDERLVIAFFTYMRLEIKKIGINGEGIGYFKRMPVFINGCFPGEIVEVELTEKGKYFTGSLKKIIKKSNRRVKPLCPYQNSCGGCALMPLKYSEQLFYKKQLVEEALLKYAGYKGQVDKTVGCKNFFNYRNKCNLPIVDNNGKLANAMYKTGSNKPIIIEDCLLHDKKIETIRKKVLEVLNAHHYPVYDKKVKEGVRHLVIRGFDNEYQLVLVTGKETISTEIITELENIKGLVSIYQGINTQKNPVKMMPDTLKLLSGEKKINMQLNDYHFKLSPQAFFQLNSETAGNIYEAVNELITEKTGTIVEAFCGIGAISLYLHDRADKVIGIDLDESAIKNARENCWLNEINNVEFIAEDANKALRNIVKSDDIDVLVVDPPRTGLSDDFLKTVMSVNIDKIVYVSCNPATLAKNMAVLQKKYEIRLVKPYDMFPNTPLVEVCALLVHK